MKEDEVSEAAVRSRGALAFPLPFFDEVDLEAGLAVRFEEEELDADTPAPALDGVE